MSLKYAAPLAQRLRTHLRLPARVHPTAVTTHRAARDGDAPTFGQQLAEQSAAAIGSWRFLIIQAGFLIAWVVVNALRLVGFDPPPFILLNLLLSFQAAFTGPVLLIAANVGAIRDHAQYDRIERLVAQNERLEERIERMDSAHDEKLGDIRALLREHTELLAQLLPERPTMLELPVVPSGDGRPGRDPQTGRYAKATTAAQAKETETR